MRVWIVEATEPLPFIDKTYRDLRCGMLAKTLVAKGHQVVWWTSTFDHMKKEYRFTGARHMEAIPGLMLQLMHGPRYKRNVSLARVRYHHMLSRFFREEAGKMKSSPDIVFTCLPIPELAEQAVLYSQRQGVPVIVDARDQWPDLYLSVFPSYLQGIVKFALTPEFARVKRTFRMATGITAVSRTYMDWALNYAGRPMHDKDGVFPLGFPVQATSTQNEIDEMAVQMQNRYGLHPETVIITFIGTFGSSYDLGTVVRAAKELLERGVDSSHIVFLLAGGGDDSERLQQMAMGLPNVIFTGWLDNIAIAALLKLSSVGLVAYKNGAMQSLPNKPFEYMAAGTPLLSSLKGELEDLISREQIGLQYQAGNVFSLIERIHWLVANQETRKQMGVRALKLFKERFSSDVVYYALTSHLEKIANTAK